MILRVSWPTYSLALVVLVATLLGPAASRTPEDDELAWKEFEEFREWRRSRNELEKHGVGKDVGKTSEDSSSNKDSGEKPKPIGEEAIIDAIDNQSSESVDPPPSDQPALMGRFIVNQADWTSVATISSRKDIATFPFANVISFSDGPLGNGTGIPYMYLTPLDFTAQDLARDHRATLMMTLAQGSYCKEKVMDPMDPRCARIVLTGKIKAVKPNSSEYPVAKSAVFGRHPWLATMPADHHFFFATLKIGSIAVLDAFGGPKYISVKDYLHPSTANDRKERRHRYDSRDKQAMSYGSRDNMENRFTSVV